MIVEQCDRIVARGNEVRCELKAIQEDLTTHLLSGKKVGMQEPDEMFKGFDMVAMCVRFPLISMPRV